MTLDLENLPQPETLKLSDLPGIKADLIREKVAEGNTDYLISLFDWMQRAKNRAESLATVYFNQMEVLHKRLNDARENPGSASRIRTKEKKPTDTSDALIFEA